MACKRAKCDAIPVRTQQGVGSSVASRGSCCEFRYEVNNRTVPICMTDFDQYGVGGEKLGVGANAVDSILCHDMHQRALPEIV